MFKKTKSFLHETKSKVALVHGFTACIGAVILSYLSTLLLSIFLEGDYAVKIIPSMITAPILMSIWGIWILFSKTRYIALKKTFFSSSFLLICLYFSINGF